ALECPATAKFNTRNYVRKGVLRIGQRTRGAAAHLESLPWPRVEPRGKVSHAIWLTGVSRDLSYGETDKTAAPFRDDGTAIWSRSQKKKQISQWLSCALRTERVEGHASRSRRTLECSGAGRQPVLKSEMRSSGFLRWLSLPASRQRSFDVTQWLHR